MQMDSFDSSAKWECLFSHWVKPIGEQQKICVGQRSPRKCRFCERDGTAATFQSDAHVIPAAFGNRSLFSYEECDDCNQRLGSRLENDFANYLALPRALSRLPARRGSPKIKSATNQKAFIQGRPTDNHVHAFLPTENEGIQIRDDRNGQFHLSIDLPKHCRLNVAKSIARMTLFCLETTNPGYDELLDWVRGRRDWYPVPLLTLHWPGSGYNAVGCSCHKYVKDPERNIVRCEFFYSSYLTVVPIPLDGQPLPERFSPLEYPEPVREMMLDNSSYFLIQDDSIEAKGIAEAQLSYDSSVSEPSP